MKILGLTGPSGAGKGEVASLLSARNVPVLDADAIYHTLLIPPSPCLDALVGHFGDGILTPEGCLDRTALGSIVFGNAEKLSTLNIITHRFVMEEVHRRLAELEQSGVPLAILDAPQLFEAGAEKDCDLVIAVLADRAIRKERILARDGIPEEAVERRLNAQKSDEFFLERADEVLWNNGSAEQLREALDALLARRGVRYS